MSHQPIKGSRKALVRVQTYHGSNEKPAVPDNNGHMPIIFDTLAGSMPSKRVRNGTLAHRHGFAKYKERHADDKKSSDSSDDDETSSDRDDHELEEAVLVVKWRETQPDDYYGRQFEIKRLFDVTDDYDKFEQWEEKLGDIEEIRVHREEDVETYDVEEEEEFSSEPDAEHANAN